MAVRNQHSRRSSNTVDLKIGEIYLTLISKDWTVDKSVLYRMKNKIINGKIQIPSIESKTGICPFLLGYCTKDNIEFIWN